MTDLETRLAALRSTFIDRTAADLPALRAAIAAGERGDAVRIAHRLAGAAGMYGFGAFGEAASALEQALEAGADCERAVTLLAEAEALSPSR